VKLIWPWQDRKQTFSWLKASTFALMFVPAIWLVDRAATGEFGAKSDSAGTLSVRLGPRLTTARRDVRFRGAIGSACFQLGVSPFSAWRQLVVS
jgi:hypothetical protein